MGWTETPLQCYGLAGNSTRVLWIGQKLHWSAMGWPHMQLGAVGQIVCVTERRDWHRLAFEKSENGKIGSDEIKMGEIQRLPPSIAPNIVIQEEQKRGFV